MQDLVLRGNTKTGQHLEDSAKMSGCDHWYCIAYHCITLIGAEDDCLQAVLMIAALYTFIYTPILYLYFIVTF